MRYEARETPQGWQVVDTANPCRDHIALRIEESEAGIIVFALNAIADGFVLLAATTIPDEVVRQYTGSTEDVAP